MENLTIFFKADKAPAHTSRLSKNFVQENGIRCVKWPGNSPDLNAIENGFGLAKRRLKDYNCTNRAMVITHFKEVRDLKMSFLFLWLVSCYLQKRFLIKILVFLNNQLRVHVLFLRKGTKTVNVLFFERLT